MRLALPTKGKRGMRDEVSEVFARAATLTFVDVEDGEVGEVMVEENEASGLKQGSGPIVVRMLAEEGVDVVVAGELGPGAKTLLEMNGIGMVQITPGIRVKEAVAKALEELLRATSRT